MSVQPADQQVEDTSLDAEITAEIETLREEHDTEAAALRPPMLFWPRQPPRRRPISQCRAGRAQAPCR